MKLHELKQATQSLRLPDLDHVNEMGKTAYKMGIDRSANPVKLGRGHDAWTAGWDFAKRNWENFLYRNGGKLW